MGSNPNHMGSENRVVDLSGAFIKRANLRDTDLTRANLSGANLSGADFSHAILREADFAGAIMDGTILIGADLRGAKNLTKTQIEKSVIDETTRLPDDLTA